MIDTYDLVELLKEYRIDGDKVLSNNSNILNKGKYDDIKNILDYLVKKLYILPQYIEKCPSVMYMNVNAVKHNYEFLSKSDITISNVDNCLHVLSVEPIELVKTYKYILENYGITLLNKKTTILRVSVDRIKKIEDFGLEKELTLSAAASNYSLDHLRQIIEVCNKYNVEIVSSVFQKTATELEKIIKVCNSNNIKITGIVFHKTALEIEKIIEVCNKNNIDIISSLFMKTSEEIEKIVDICRKNNVEITGRVFMKTSKEVE